jgi:agmatinase
MRRAVENGFNLVQIGARNYSEELEMKFARGNPKIKIFEWGKGNGNERFIEPTYSEIISAIPTENVYLTIDVDGFDPSTMGETGTPFPGGFDFNYGALLINQIFQRKNVIGADVVEVAPLSENSTTAIGAAQLIYSMIGQHVMKRRRK